jgi:hypothetical protein
MANPPTVPKKKDRIFPFVFQSNGRIGRIKLWPSGLYATQFSFAGEQDRNTFKTFEAAWLYLHTEFSRLDTDRANARSQHALNADVRTYSELEQLLRSEGSGATLREAVTYYLANHKKSPFKPRKFSACEAAFREQQKRDGISTGQCEALAKHFRRFSRGSGEDKKLFRDRDIDSFTTLEISDWLNRCRDEKTDELWGWKTRTSVRGSLVSLSRYAQETLKAIPLGAKTEFQLVRTPKRPQRQKVEIYKPEELETLLMAAIESDIDLIPAIVLGALQGLRPAEVHAENADRPPFSWEEINWGDRLVHVTGQKVRSKQTRDFLLQPATARWLEPFRKLKGAVWRYKQAHSKKLIALRERAEVRSVYDGFRRSYASYRIRELRGNLDTLAAEMGNSPKEILGSYKRNVTDREAAKWFGVVPPSGYAEKIKAVLDLRATVQPAL